MRDALKLRRRRPGSEILKLSGLVDSFADDLFLTRAVEYGTVEYSLSEEAAKHDLLGKRVAVRMDDAVRVVSENRVRVRWRGLLSLDSQANLRFDGEAVGEALALKPGDSVRVELEEAAFIFSEPRKIVF